MKVIRIGKAEDNEYVIPNDPTISRYHCQLVLDDSGQYSIIDLSSLNGTWVNGHRISGTQMLSRMDIVKIGNTALNWYGLEPNRPIVNPVPHDPTVPAGFWIRVLSYYIDGVIAGLTSFVIAANLFNIFVVIFAFGSIGDIIDNFSYAYERHLGIFLLGMMLAFLSLIITNWMYYALSESSINQATIGKKAFGIKVTDENGERITFGRATGRYFSKILSGLIFCIGYFIAGWNPEKQGLHDMIAKTKVVRSI